MDDDHECTRARGMYARDGEYVEFVETFDCVGPVSSSQIQNNVTHIVFFSNFDESAYLLSQVEKWLNQLTEIMKQTGKKNIENAVSTYDEKPREQWLFDFPAQTALCATQIWWTSEVNMAFSRMEEGYESALKDYNRKQVNYFL